MALSSSASSSGSSDLLTRVVQWVLGVLGVFALIRLVPRIFSFVTRRFVVGIIGEILMVAAAALLTERLVGRRPRHDTNGTTE
jgi:hypothetical protein